MNIFYIILRLLMYKIYILLYLSLDLQNPYMVDVYSYDSIVVSYNMSLFPNIKFVINLNCK